MMLDRARRLTGVSTVRLCLAIVLAAWSCHALAKPQPDQTLVEIQRNTELTADHTQKDYYDYLAVAISILAFVVAGITLHYTVRTYRSQKKTEANTTPTINREIQKSLLLENLSTLYEIYIYLFALFFYLRKHGHRAMPSAHFWNNIRMHQDQFHDNLFYSDIDQWRKFTFLKDAIQTIDNDLCILRSCIENPEATSDEKEKEFGHLIDEAGYVLWAYKPVIEDIYHEDYLALVKKHFYTPQDTNITNLFKAKYVHPDEHYTRFYMPDREIEETIGDDIVVLLGAARAHRCLSEAEISSFTKQILEDVSTVLLLADYTDGSKERKMAQLAVQYNGKYHTEAQKLPKQYERWFFHFKHFG